MGMKSRQPNEDALGHCAVKMWIKKKHKIQGDKKEKEKGENK